MITPPRSKCQFVSKTTDIAQPYAENYAAMSLYDVWWTSARTGHTKVIRRYVTLYPKKGSGASETRTTYARYLMNCHLWKTQGTWIPDDMEVDHVNGNPLDDRIENLEIVTQQENIRRRDRLTYASQPIDDKLIQQAGSLLRDGESRVTIAKTLGVTPGYLRWLIAEHLPDCNTDAYLPFNLPDIKYRRERGHALEDIADAYGCSKTSIMRLIRTHLPELDENYLREKQSKAIADCVSRGLHYTDIAHELSLTKAAVISHLKSYHADAYEKMLSDSRAAKEKVVEKQKNIVEKARPFLPYCARAHIATYLGISESHLNRYVSLWAPEYKIDSRKKPYAKYTISDILSKVHLNKEPKLVLDIPTPLNTPTAKPDTPNTPLANTLTRVTRRAYMAKRLDEGATVDDLWTELGGRYLTIRNLVWKNFNAHYLKLTEANLTEAEYAEIMTYYARVVYLPLMRAGCSMLSLSDYFGLSRTMVEKWVDLVEPGPKPYANGSIRPDEAVSKLGLTSEEINRNRPFHGRGELYRHSFIPTIL